MALRVLDNFDGYANRAAMVETNSPWSPDAGLVVEQGTGTDGHNRALLAGGMGYCAANASSFSFGCHAAFKLQTPASFSDLTFFQFSATSSVSGGRSELRINTSGQVSITDFADSGHTVLGTSIVTVPVSSDVAFEVYLYRHATDGIARVWMDGVLIIDYTGSTIGGSPSSMEWFRSHWGWLGANTGLNEVVMWDDSIGIDRKGDLVVEHLGTYTMPTLLPTGTGTYNDFTANTGTTWQAVDEFPTPDGDTTYITASALNQKQSFTVTGPGPISGQVIAVGMLMSVRRTNTSNPVRYASLVIDSGGNEYTKVEPVNLPTSYARQFHNLIVFDQDANSVDDLQIGFVQTAYNAATELRYTQLAAMVLVLDDKISLEATSYANPFAAGNRSSLITVTRTGFTESGGVVQNLVNGNGGANASGAFWASIGDVGSGPTIIHFLFASPVVITEARLFTSANNSLGTFQWQVFDGSWVDIGDLFTLRGGSTLDNYNALTELASNTAFSNEYRLLGASDPWSSNPWVIEMLFKAASDAPMVLHADFFDEAEFSAEYIFPVDLGSVNFEDESIFDATVTLVDTSYTYPLGSGDRVADITLSVVGFDFVEGTITSWIDGDIDSDGFSAFFPISDTVFCEFDLGGFYVINEVTFYQAGFVAQGSWDWYGWTGTQWVLLAEFVVWDSPIYVDTSLSNNIYKFSKYKLQGRSGTFQAPSEQYEIEFKIGLENAGLDWQYIPDFGITNFVDLASFEATLTPLPIPPLPTQMVIVITGAY